MRRGVGAVDALAGLAAAALSASLQELVATVSRGGDEPPLMAAHNVELPLSSTLVCSCVRASCASRVAAGGVSFFLLCDARLARLVKTARGGPITVNDDETRRVCATPNRVQKREDRLKISFEGETLEEENSRGKRDKTMKMMPA